MVVRLARVTHASAHATFEETFRGVEGWMMMMWVVRGLCGFSRFECLFRKRWGLNFDNPREKIEL